jgi:hypothetical protein
MHDRLKEGDGGVSEQIRQRVERSFDHGAFESRIDHQTREFIIAVAECAREVELETGDAWHSHAGAHAAFRQAILSLLARLKPEGPIAFGDRSHQSMPGNDPQEVGIWVEYTVHTDSELSFEQRDRLRAEKEKTFREIVALHQQAQQEGKS